MNDGKRIGGKRLVTLVVGAAALVVLVGIGIGRLGPWVRERAMHNSPLPLSVLVVTLDTTRADRIGAYGSRTAETPHLDALARQGTLFRQAYAHVPLTLPSHTSLMTGLLPTRHGVRDNGTFVVPRDLALLSERFRDAGYQTAAFVSAFVLDRRFGLSRGFDTYEDEVAAEEVANGSDPSERSVRAEETVSRALAWLGTRDGRPRFLWVHLFDPHAPYDPPQPFASRHRDQPYDGEIAYVDAQFGRLMSAVEEIRQPGGWLTVVAGDHGEGLGDHEEMTHGYFVYSNTQRVPLIMALPGHVPTDRTVDGIVRLVDVAPTILDLSGLPALKDVDGRSLTRLMAGRDGADPGPAYIESFHPRIWWGAQELRALRTNRWLFIDAPRPELYDVEADPGERTNLAASRPQELEWLGSLLREYVRAGSPIREPGHVDREAEARLRALGYLGSGQMNPGPGAELPDAKDNGPLLDTVTRGQDLAARGRHEEALALFRNALQTNPRSVAVRMRIAETLLSLHRYTEAFSAYGDVAATRFAPDSAYVGMARARLGQGQVVEALAVTKAGLQAAPGSVYLNTQHGDLLLQLKRPVEAEQAFRKALAAVPEDEAARWGLGVALSREGRKQESVDVFLALAEDSPRSPQGRATADALELWANERLDAGAPQDARRGYEAVLGTGRTSVSLFLNLGLALWQSGRQADALAVIDRGLTRFAASTDLLYRKGRILEQLGRNAEARATFEHMLELAPGNAEAEAGVRRTSPVSR